MPIAITARPQLCSVRRAMSQEHPLEPSPTGGGDSMSSEESLEPSTSAVNAMAVAQTTRVLFLAYRPNNYVFNMNGLMSFMEQTLPPSISPSISRKDQPVAALLNVMKKDFEKREEKSKAEQMKKKVQKVPDKVKKTRVAADRQKTGY